MNRKLKSNLPQGRQKAGARMPGPDVYEQEYDYWPWGKLLKEATRLVAENAPPSSFIVDYMCGTGFLLRKILSKRNDLSAIGCDIRKSYVDYARTTYPAAQFVRADARTYKPQRRPDFVICTAGLHHLDRRDQPRFIAKVADELPLGGFLLLGEEVIRDYRSESERKRATLELFSELMRFLDGKKTPEAVVQAAADMLVNDWCARGEYKTSRIALERMLRPFFKVISARQIWPPHRREFGDWLFLCQKR